MLKAIILNKKLPIKYRLKNLIAYWYKKRGTLIIWNKRFNKIFVLHPEYKTPVDKTSEKEHKKNWLFFNSNVNLATYRVCSNISSISNTEYVPEEIFTVDIEPTLNNEKLEGFLAIKNFYTLWFGKDCAFPEIFLNKINGAYFDGELNPIDESEVETIFKNLSDDFVLKPTKDTYGGKGVLLSPPKEKAWKILNREDNVIIQERIFLNEQYSKITGGKPVSTRILMYKSIYSDVWHILSNQLRCAVGNSLDNTSDGGIITCINHNGIMDGFATDAYGKKYSSHPDTKIDFVLGVPEIEQLEKLIHLVCNRVFFSRLISLDLVLDQKRKWRMIEVNFTGITIRSPQYHGMPVFGEFTDEILEYCKKNHWALAIK